MSTVVRILVGAWLLLTALHHFIAEDRGIGIVGVIALLLYVTILYESEGPSR